MRPGSLIRAGLLLGLLSLGLIGAGPASALDIECNTRDYGYCADRSPGSRAPAGSGGQYLGRSFVVANCGTDPGQNRYDAMTGWDDSNSLAWNNGQNVISHMSIDNKTNGCPWGGPAYGAGGGLYATTTPVAECSGGSTNCDSTSLGYRTGSYVSAGFQFSAPSGTAIGEVGSSPTFVTQAEYGNGTNQTIPHWGAWFSADSASSANAIRGCYDYSIDGSGYSAGAANVMRIEKVPELMADGVTLYMPQCNSIFHETYYNFNAGGSGTGWDTNNPTADTTDTDTRHYWYRPLLDSGGLPTKLYSVLQCYTIPCTAYRGKYQNDYNSRMNLKGINVKLVDQQDPTQGPLGGSMVDGAWKNGSYTLTAPQYDNTGVVGDRVAPGGPNGGGLIDHADDLNVCSTMLNGTRVSSHGLGNFWYVSQPCVLSRSGSWSVNACAASDGSASSFTLTTYDPAGNTASTGFSAKVDCSAPVTYPAEAPECGVDTGLRVYGVDSSYIATGSWLKKGTIQVRGQGCDTSPMTLGEVQVRSSSNNSSWSGAVTTGISSCTFPSGVSAHQDSPLQCNFNTAVFSEGTYVQFRVRMDSTGGTGYSDWGSSYRVDNTANRPGTISWSPALSVPNGWTNRSTITASWTLDSSGSPTTAVWYSYQPGPSGSGACALGAATLLPLATSSSVDLTNSPSVPCQQGQHTLNVWQVDASGNGSSAFARTDTYRYDSVVPSAPTAGAVDPSDWTTYNNFRVDYTNPLITNTATESPFVRTFHRIGDQDPVPLGGDTSCLGSGVRCTVTGITVPPVTGAYPYLTWLRDEAGNTGDELDLTLRYTDGQCLRS